MTILSPHSRFENVNQLVQEMSEVIESIKLSMRSAQDRTEHCIFYILLLLLLLKFSRI